MLFRFWVFPDCTFLDISTCNVNFLWEGAREGYLFSKKRYPSLIRVPHTRWGKTGNIGVQGVQTR